VLLAISRGTRLSSPACQQPLSPIAVRYAPSSGSLKKETGEILPSGWKGVDESCGVSGLGHVVGEERRVGGGVKAKDKGRRGGPWEGVRLTSNGSGCMHPDTEMDDDEDDASDV